MTWRKTEIVYIDGIDWLHEIGEVDTTVWPSKESILKNTPCAHKCGIIMCKIEPIEWVLPSDHSQPEIEKTQYNAMIQSKIDLYQKRIDALALLIPSKD